MGCCGGPRPQNTNGMDNNSDQNNEHNAGNAGAGISMWLMVGLAAILVIMFFFR